MKVLVIPEDPTYNGYILKPLVERLLRAASRPSAKVTVLTNPRAQGIDMIRALLPTIWADYAHFDLLLFLPDDDCPGRAARLLPLEAQAVEAGVRFLVCTAVTEVEAWLLAGHVDKSPEQWPVVRADCELKERYFAPFIAEYGDGSAGQGRTRLMREALTHFTGILARCPELAELKTRLEAVLG